MAIALKDHLLLSRTEARALDDQDTLARFRDRFHLPVGADAQPLVYFCGHSLGLQPRAVADQVLQELDLWSKRGVYGHFEGARPWYSYHEPVSALMAPIVGGLPSEVVLMNSLTVNLHLLMVSFYRPTQVRFKVVFEDDTFPSDRFAIESQVRYHGFDPRSACVCLRPREGEDLLRTEDVLEYLEGHADEVALVLLGGVNFITGQALDMAAIAAAAHNCGALIGFDLAHAAGNLPLSLHDWDVDFALWCTYKYLNSGPGGVGGAFVHERHGESWNLPRLAGWWGHDPTTRFANAPKFAPQLGAAGWQLSNAPILSMAACRASLEIFEAAGMPALRAKSIHMTAKLLAWLEPLLDRHEIKVITPRVADSRGCQLSLRMPGDPKALLFTLEKMGFAVDFREPGIVRLAPVPLYNTFSEISGLVWAMATIMEGS